MRFFHLIKHWLQIVLILLILQPLDSSGEILQPLDSSGEILQPLDSSGDGRALWLRKPLCDHRRQSCCSPGRDPLFLWSQDSGELIVLGDFLSARSPRREGRADRSVAPKGSVAQCPGLCWMISRVPLLDPAGHCCSFLRSSGRVGPAWPAPWAAGDPGS